MTHWRRLENYLTSTAMLGQAFDSATLAADLGITGPEASALIQSYLEAQRSLTSPTLYVLYRTGRTNNAVWHVGSRAQDMRTLGSQFHDDMHLRLTRALEPDLIRMGILNPRAMQVSDAIANAVEANLALLAASL